MNQDEAAKFIVPTAAATEAEACLLPSHEVYDQDRAQASDEEPVRQEAETGRRRITMVLLAGAVLVTIAMATGIGLPGLSGGPSSPSANTLPATSRVASHQRTSVPVQGTVTASIQHLRRHTWRFVYTVHNTGNLPIAGFELNALRSNLFHVWGKAGWSHFGSGICGSRHGTVLVYWSTGRGGPLVSRLRTARFGFTVNTSGPKPVGYSLSWGSAPPKFGTIPGPAPSSLLTTVPCDR